MTTTEELMQCIALLHGGSRVDARTQLEALWGRLAESDHFHRCVLAHYMADSQDAVESELEWDERALAAATAASPSEFDGRFPGMALSSFFPSLHLNVASALERLGRRTEALEHAERANEAAGALGDDPLAKMTREGIERLRRRLDLSCPPGPVAR